MAETFLVAFERRERFDQAHEKALPWLLGIATVLIRKHRGVEARFLRAVAASGPPEIVDNEHDEHDGHDDRLDASRLVRGLAGAAARSSTTSGHGRIGSVTGR